MKKEWMVSPDVIFRMVTLFFGNHQVVGQGKAIRRIDVLRKRGLSGRAYWLSGQSGTGKTTIARLLAAEIADDFNTLAMFER